MGSQIARSADADRLVLVPVLCMAEAYRQVNPGETDLLEIIQSHPTVHVTSVDPDMAPLLGGFSKTLGAVDLAQLVVTAAEHQIQVMTSQRKVITKILPEEWPIIDL